MELFSVFVTVYVADACIYYNKIPSFQKFIKHLIIFGINNVVIAALFDWNIKVRFLYKGSRLKTKISQSPYLCLDQS